MLKKQNLLQVPKLVREQTSLEPPEVVKVTLTVIGKLGAKESFLTRIHKDGRIAVPRLILALLSQGEPNIRKYVIEVTLEPTYH
jgi:hypothetical protein